MLGESPNPITRSTLLVVVTDYSWDIMFDYVLATTNHIVPGEFDFMWTG